MKAEELMIGDYVHVKPSGMLVRVAAVHRKKVAYHSCANKLVWVRKDLQEPIPLTPEILEKNGFVLESYCGNVMSGKWWTRNDFVIHENMNDSVGKNNFSYEYVHQLQHALRLCGIEKEIEL